MQRLETSMEASSLIRSVKNLCFVVYDTHFLGLLYLKIFFMWLSDNETLQSEVKIIRRPSSSLHLTIPSPNDHLIWSSHSHTHLLL